MQTKTTSPSSPIQPTRPAPPRHRPDPGHVRKAMVRRSFATLATTSPAGRPHVAGVLFELIDGVMYISTSRSSRKARNVAADPHVAMCVPIRRLPVGPPSTVQFQATATVLDSTDPEIVALLDRGGLKSITGHGELDHPDGCFLRVALGPRLVTYGLGMSLRTLMADPLDAGGAVEWIGSD